MITLATTVSEISAAKAISTGLLICAHLNEKWAAEKGVERKSIPATLNLVLDIAFTVSGLRCLFGARCAAAQIEDELQSLFNQGNSWTIDAGV
jgi:hypothetical protein